MKKFLSAMLAAVMMLSMCTVAMATGPKKTENPFTDVKETDWYYPGVMFCYEKGLMSGGDGGKFDPNGTMTRGMMAAVMWRAVGAPKLDKKDYGDTFSDVKSGMYYEEAIYWCRNNGVMSGYSKDSFGPNDNITREQIVTVLWRYLGSPDAKADDFVDETDISGFAQKAVDWARNTKVVGGYSDGRFGPKDNATRAQVATIFKNFVSGK